LKVGSDFSGVGAFDQALKRLGFDYKTVFACDMDKYARQTYIENYGEPDYFPKNVYDREIPEESLDIYMTSPPCQTFSLAGKRKAEDDKRGILFYNSLEFIKKNKPKIFIFENVKGLLSADNGKVFQNWLQLLGNKINGNTILFPHKDSANYSIYWQVLNSKDYGVPQNRERVFIVGFREDREFTFPKKEYLKLKLKDILENKVDDKYFLSEENVNKLLEYNKRQKDNGNGFTAKFHNPNKDNMSALKVGGQGADDLITHSLYPRSGDPTKGGTGHLSKSDNTSYCVDTGNSQAIEVKSAALRTRDKKGNEKRTKRLEIRNDNVANAITSHQLDSIIKEQTNIRRLTPRECFRLQDFPETFKWICSDSQAYKQAGNSITVGVLTKIIEKCYI
jgi:DNA (cytosine-5)-methyltransferase 1